MTRRAWLIAPLVCSAALLGAADSPHTLKAARWTAPDRVDAVLSTEPGQCLVAANDPAMAESIAIGAAAFRAPLLLGGQAARSGLSCNSCHRGGHDNPGFTYPGLSDAPGTADVTSSLFSSHRGDFIFNPVRIPNLSGPKALLKIDQSPTAGLLRPFLRGLIVEEFNGPEPSQRILTGLADYVSALSPAACQPATRLDLASALARVDAALTLAERSAAGGDGATARLLLSAARSEMELIDERFAAAGMIRSVAPLRRASLGLGVIERAVVHDPTGTVARLNRWRKSQAKWRNPLLAAQDRSFYNPVVLHAQLM